MQKGEFVMPFSSMGHFRVLCDRLDALERQRYMLDNSKGCLSFRHSVDDDGYPLVCELPIDSEMRGLMVCRLDELIGCLKSEIDALWEVAPG